MSPQLCVMADMLAGLWVAISPWFITLRAYGGNATANDLIVGLAVVALAVFAVAGRGLADLQAASALAGVWLIISPFILNAKFPITAAMYWSNVWAGGVIAVLALGALVLSRTAAAR
jgi:SPW repeat